jgi:hypothetical protein
MRHDVSMHVVAGTDVTVRHAQPLSSMAPKQVPDILQRPSSAGPA